MKKIIPDSQPLTPAVFHILLALADGDKHGYRIMQAVRANSRNEFLLGPGTLYTALRRMLAEGQIIEVDERPDPQLDDQRRRYYRLAERGRRDLRAELERMDRLVQRARALKILPTTEGTS
jgi:DNA-binding PadR family transcriptional regulator